MKRLLFGFLWFMGLYLGCNFALGFTVGFQGGLEGQSDEQINQTLEATQKKLDDVILLASVTTALVGTATQKLPGTRE